jgi:soluble lytic murein transglycosylase-like protein
VAKSFRQSFLMGIGAAAALVFGVHVTQPVFLGQGPAGALLQATAVDPLHSMSPWIAAPRDSALQSATFLADRQAFADDLLRTGKVSTERAWRIADVAVREAYIRRVPPALVLGVMLTENDQLKSSARSKVGALGLMQVNPTPWKGLARLFGANLSADSVNLKYGVFILGHLASEAGKRDPTEETGWRTALLRYNGCVRGTNTPNCHSYPDVVRRNVLRSARFSCGGRSFDDCVVRPLWESRREVVSSGD